MEKFLKSAVIIELKSSVWILHMKVLFTAKDLEEYWIRFHDNVPTEDELAFHKHDFLSGIKQLIVDLYVLKNKYSDVPEVECLGIDKEFIIDQQIQLYPAIDKPRPDHDLIRELAESYVQYFENFVDKFKKLNDISEIKESEEYAMMEGTLEQMLLDRNVEFRTHFMTPFNLASKIKAMQGSYPNVKFELLVNGERYEENENPILPAECMRIFGNLIGNALNNGADYIQLEINDNENGYECFVLNTGSYIPADIKHRIFEKYFSTATGEHIQGNGSGLGLAFCKSTLEKWEGYIKLKQNDPPIFEFFIPKAVCPAYKSRFLSEKLGSNL